MTKRRPRPMIGRQWGYANERTRDDSRARGHAASAKTNASKKIGVMPSQLFDWDTALFLNAQTMRDLGYPLSREQRRMLKDA